MRSEWYELQPTAIKLRRRGLSIRQIEKKLKIPRSTLSGWFRKVRLAAKFKRELYRAWKNGLVLAREKAALWHRAQKLKRLQEAKIEASAVLRNIDVQNVNILELTLAVLYFAEGTKKKDETSLGNSDPAVLKFFVSASKTLYNLDVTKTRCYLNLRADQNPERMKHYWAKELNLPYACFKRVNTDPRTKGVKTYPGYNGVCSVYYGGVSIQRKLINLGRMFFEKVIENNKGN